MHFSSVCRMAYVLALVAVVNRAATLAAKIDTMKMHDIAAAAAAARADRAFKASDVVQLKLMPIASIASNGTVAAVDDSHEQTALETTNTTTKAAQTTTTTLTAPAPTTKSLSIYNAVHGLWNWLRYDVGESLLGDSVDDSTSLAGRTFGKIRRLQMALIPIMFKFGVLSAMIAFLVMVSMKTLFLVKVLVLMNAVAILSKFLTLKTNFGGFEQHSIGPTHYSNWNPSGWAAAAASSASSLSSSALSGAAPSKEIHLHIHGGQLQSQGPSPSSSYSSYGHGSSNHWERRSDPYGAYDHLAINDVNGGENELTPIAPINVLSTTKYPSNHRSY